MAADPFNSKSGYTVGIPPYTVIDANGNVYANFAEIGNVTISGDQVVTGTISANLFTGTFEGNITGNFVVPGLNTYVVYNDNGNAGASQFFTFDSGAKLLTVDGDLVANSITLGSQLLEFSTQRVFFATTNSSAPDQVLYTVAANTIISVDFTVIATDAIGNNRQTSKLFASILGTEVGYYEIATIDVPYMGPGVGDFVVRYNAGNIELTVQPVTSSLVDYRIMVTTYKE